MSKRLLIGAMAMCLSATAATADDFGYFAPTLFEDGVETDGDGPLTLGWTFELRGYNMLYGLGLYDAGEPGFAQPHTVTLWDAAGVVVASVEITGGDEVNRFVYTGVEVQYLPAGIYTIGASDLGMGDGYVVADEFGTSPYVRYLGGRYAPGAGVQFPLLTDSITRFGPGIWLVIPEPATWALMVGGFGLIGAALRRKARVAVRSA